MTNLTVIIPSHNPRHNILIKVIDSLRHQTMPHDQWELLLIDNASTEPLSSDLVNWHPHGRLIREPQLGLTVARVRGLTEAKNQLLVWVDDDNLLDSTYLVSASDAFADNPKLGAAGGASFPLYQEPPPPWFNEGLAPLGCRDCGDKVIRMSWTNHQPHYPHSAPIGAGLVIRRSAMQLWANAMDSEGLALGRRGTALSSGEDNDINLTLLRAGWDLAYLPQLRLTHIIPPSRLKLDYQKRLARASFRDFVRVLDRHGIRPWSAIPGWSVPFRAVLAWLCYRAWICPGNQVRWCGAVGQYEGRAALSK